MITLVKMGHVWKKESNLEKGSLLENGSQVEKWVALRKIGDTWKNGSHLKK